MVKCRSAQFERLVEPQCVMEDLMDLTRPVRVVKHGCKEDREEVLSLTVTHGMLSQWQAEELQLKRVIGRACFPTVAWQRSGRQRWPKAVWQEGPLRVGGRGRAFGD